MADHAYFALSTLHTRFVGRPAGRRAASITHAHGAVPDYIIDYRSKRTCSIGFQSRFRDFCQDFKISGKISRFRARFQDFRQDFRDFKISGKISEISRFQARFPKDFKISIRFPKDFKDFVCECTRFQGVADPSVEPRSPHAQAARGRISSMDLCASRTNRFTYTPTTTGCVSHCASWPEEEEAVQRPTSEYSKVLCNCVIQLRAVLVSRSGQVRS